MYDTMMDSIALVGQADAELAGAIWSGSWSASAGTLN